MNPKLSVIGLDGAHFELIEPWINSGHLPNIREQIRNGFSSDLDSVLPPVTSPNWKCYSTGKNPGKIGLFWWENIDTERQKVHYPDERKHENIEFWELIASSEPVGVLGVPTTHPPKQIDKFLISGAPDGENTGFAHPDHLESKLKNELDYSVIKTERLEEDSDKAVDEILRLIESRFEAAEYLVEEYNISFLQVTTFYLNSLHHFLWDDSRTLEAWKIIDKYVGRFAEISDNLMIMSDHGATEIKTVFNINTWLEQNGYLETENSLINSVSNYGVSSNKVVNIVDFLGIHDILRKHSPSRLLELVDYLPNEDGEIKQKGKSNVINWDETIAIASGQGPIYLTIDEKDPSYHKIRDNLISDLSSIINKEGKPITDGVLKREDIYSGGYIEEAPDIIINQSKSVHITGGIGRPETFEAPDSQKWLAENKRTGIFVANGSEIGTGQLETISILDLAPTILHLFDIPVPSDFDGEVQQTIFKRGSNPAEREPNRQRPTESANPINSTSNDELKSKLRDLGYIE